MFAPSGPVYLDTVSLHSFPVHGTGTIRFPSRDDSVEVSAAISHLYALEHTFTQVCHASTEELEGHLPPQGGWGGSGNLDGG